MPTPSAVSCAPRCFRSPTLLALLAGLFLATFSAALAQSTAELAGRVMTGGGSTPLRNARVSLEGTGFATVTDVAGRFRFPAVPAGNHTLVASYIGYPERRVSVTAGSGVATVPDIVMDDDTVRMEKFVVEGELSAQRRALNAQRAASNISNVVSADAIGRLPDSNLAEALKRMPGISLVNNQQTGEGEQIAVRGLDSALNSYSINGVRVATANSNNRSVSFNQIGADGFETVEVEKTLTPVHDADAIGGAINLKTPTAFDYGQRVLRGGIETNYNSYTGDFSYKGRVAAGEIFLGGKLGAYVSYSYEKKHIRAEESENAGDWEPFNYFPNANSFAAPNDTVQMQGLDLARWENRLQRRGLNASFDYRPDKQTTLHLRLQFSDYAQKTMRSELDVRNRQEPGGFGTLVQVNPDATNLPQPVVVSRDAAKGAVYQLTPAQIVDQDGDGLITDRDRRNAANSAAARVPNGRGATDGLYSLGGRSGIWAPRGYFIDRSFQHTDRARELSTVDLGGETARGRLRLDYNTSYSFGRQDVPQQVSLSFRTPDAGSFNQEGAYFTFPDPRYPKWQLTPRAAATVYDNSLLLFNAAGASKEKVKNDQWLAQANARYDFALRENPAYVKTGFKFREAKRNYDVTTLLNLNRRTTPTLADVSDLLAGTQASYLEGQYNFGSHMSSAPLQKAVLEVDPRLFSGTSAVTALSNLQSDRRGSEAIYAGYLMGDVTVRQWEFLAGARYEYTVVDNTVWRTDRNAPAAPTADTRWDPATFTSGFTHSKASYANVTPSMHVNYRRSPNLVFRGAITTSISRPDYRWLEASESYTRNAAGLITAITRGNPDLLPASAVNYDLGFEYYTRHTGLFSVNLYHKAIDKFIYSSRSERAGSIETVDGMPVPVSEPQNGARATIDGVEVTLQRQFRFLPSPWDGLGVNLNYTFQKSEAETNLAWRAGRKTDFLNAPHRLWNLAFYYEKYGFEARLAASFNDKYIEDLRNYGHDKWVLARTMLDLKLGYRLVRGWKLSIEGHNLNNEHVYWASHGPSGAFQKDYTRTGTYWIFAANWNY